MAVAALTLVFGACRTRREWRLQRERRSGECDNKPPLLTSLTRSLTILLTILLICEKLSPFGGAVTRWPAASGGGRGIGNLFADYRSGTRGQARRGSIVCCPLFRVASARQA